MCRGELRVMNNPINNETALLEKLMNSISDLVFVMEVTSDKSFKYAFINNAAKKRLSTNDSIIGKTLEEALPAYKAKALTDCYRQALTAKNTHSFEDNENEVIYEETVLNPIYNEENEVTHVIAVIRNISDRKLLETQLKLNEQKYKSIVENNTDAVFMLDTAGSFLTVNESGEELSGYTEEELINMGFHQIVYEPELPIVVSCFQKAVAGETQEYNVHFHHKSSNLVYCAIKNIPIIIDGKVLGVYGIARDITMEHMKYESLKTQKAYYEMLVDRSPDPTVIHQDGIIRYVNYAYAKLMDAASREVLVGRHVEEFTPISQREYFRSKTEEVLSDSADSVSMEDIIFTIEGKRREVEVFSTKTTFKDKPAVHAVLRDITEKKDLERKISKMAYFDFLTDLPNRELFKETMEEMITEAKEEGQTFALLYVDGDHFKKVNDTFGHSVGDEFLKEFARRLKRSIRKDDMVARVGGDEFNILLPRVKTRDEIVTILERLFDEMKEPWEYAGRSLPMEMSIGVALYPKDGKSLKTLTRNADEALYDVKEHGGNHYRFIDERE